MSFAGDADEAFARVQQVDIDVTVTDAMMRGTDGFDLLGKLRSTACGRDIAVMMLRNFARKRGIREPIQVLVRADYRVLAMGKS